MANHAFPGLVLASAPRKFVSVRVSGQGARRTGDANRSGPDVADPDDLYRAWVAGPNARTRRYLLQTMPVPGDIALRSRYHLLTDEEAFGLAQTQFRVTRARWAKEIEVIRAADRALIANDAPAHDSAPQHLIDSHPADLHPLPVIDAHIALADGARQVDDFDAATSHLDQALRLAGESRHRFAVIRCQVSLGYLRMTSGSATEAKRQFAAAVPACREIDERIYLSAALTGLGEAHSRLREDADAISALREALTVCRALRSDVGIANAAQHLGDLHRRRRDRVPAEAALKEALDAATRADLPIGIVNAADALAEVALLSGDVDGAAGHYLSALQTAETRGYQRGTGHALNGLGRCAAAAESWGDAIQLHSHAVDAFGQVNDPLSQAAAHAGIADAATRIGDTALVVTSRAAALDAVESIREVQTTEIGQRQFPVRFAGVYSKALGSAIELRHTGLFVTAFEGVAGRRLAGLIGDVQASADAARLSGHLAIEASRPRPAPREGEPHRRELALGKLATRAALPSIAESDLAELSAKLYQRLDPARADATFQAATTGRHVLLITIMPDDDHRIAYLHARPGTDPELGTRPLPTETVDLVRRIRQRGFDRSWTIEDLHPLQHLLPESLTGSTDEQTLTIVPLGSLWTVPWTAIPTHGWEVLGEVRPVALAPSLTLLTGQRDRPRGTHLLVSEWRAKNVRHHRIRAFDDEAGVRLTRPATASQAALRLTHAVDDLAVVVSHGRLHDQVGHYLELDPTTAVTPLDLVHARTPANCVLVACWAASTPDSESADPFTLATVALTRGTTAIAATISELADDLPATMFVNVFLHASITRQLPQALHNALRTFLANSTIRRGPITRWAPLVVLANT